MMVLPSIVEQVPKVLRNDLHGLQKFVYDPGAWDRKIPQNGEFFFLRLFFIVVCTCTNETNDHGSAQIVFSFSQS